MCQRAPWSLTRGKPLVRRSGNPHFVGGSGRTEVTRGSYPIKVGLIRYNRLIDIPGNIGSNGSNRPPTAGAGRDLLLSLGRDTNLIAALDDEILLVVRIVCPSKLNGIGGLWTTVDFVCLWCCLDKAACLDSCSGSPGKKTEWLAILPRIAG